MAWSKVLKMRFPIITLSMVSASLITYAIPQLTGFFIYDRQYILAGQLWRLLTASLAHFSVSHLIWNLLVFSIVGCAIELARYRRFGFMCILAIVVPGLLFLAINPDLTQYGGLSSLSMGATAYFCLCRVQQTCKDRRLWIAIFGLLIAKIFVEVVIDAPIFARPASLPFRILPSAHVIGVAAAVIALFSERMKMSTFRFERGSAFDIYN